MYDKGILPGSQARVLMKGVNSLKSPTGASIVLMRFNHPSKALLPNTTTLGFKFQYVHFGRSQTFSLQWLQLKFLVFILEHLFNYLFTNEMVYSTNMGVLWLRRVEGKDY